MRCHFINVIQFNETKVHNIAAQTKAIGQSVVDSPAIVTKSLVANLRVGASAENPAQLHIEKFDGVQTKFTLRRPQAGLSFIAGPELWKLFLLCCMCP